MNINKTLQNIDFIGLINLIHRDDRLLNVFNEFNKHSINTNNITILRPSKHVLGGMFGCYDSHLNLYKKAIENNARYALIFEDDFEFIDELTENITKKLNICINFINKNEKNWDILKITNDLFSYIDKRIDENIYETQQGSGQGYFINKHCMEKMLNYGVLMYENEAFHVDLAQLLIYNFKIYTCMPEIIRNDKNALNNDNSTDIPEILKKDLKKGNKWSVRINGMDSAQYASWWTAKGAYLYKISSHYNSNHMLCKLLADFNLYNISDQYIYINICITLFISVITYSYLNKKKKNQNILTCIIICIIVIYFMIITQQLSMEKWSDYGKTILSKYKIKRTYINNYKYNTDNNVSEFVLK